MIDNGIMYGLRNPAFTDDIGTSMMQQMYPVPPGNPMLGTHPMMLPQGQLRGQLNNDTFDSSQKDAKDKSLLKKIALGFAAVVGGIAAFKYGGKLINYVKKFIPKKV